MRVDTVSISQSPIESPKAIEKKELTIGKPKEDAPIDEPQSFIPTPFGTGRTYSLSSLIAAVGYHAKFLTVAESNIEAANHPPVIPQLILDRFSAR
jgi:hypothetical protein